MDNQIVDIPINKIKGDYDPPHIRFKLTDASKPFIQRTSIEDVQAIMEDQTEKEKDLNYTAKHFSPKRKKSKRASVSSI